MPRPFNLEDCYWKIGTVPTRCLNHGFLRPSPSLSTEDVEGLCNYLMDCKRACQTSAGRSGHLLATDQRGDVEKFIESW